MAQFANLTEELFRAFFDQSLRGGARQAFTNVYPPINLYDDGDAFLVRAELPGVAKDSLDVSVKGAELHLSGEKRTSVPEANPSYHRRELAHGQFRRTVTLPEPVNGDAIEASFKHGVLEVKVPRLPAARERKITIN